MGDIVNTLDVDDANKLIDDISDMTIAEEAGISDIQESLDVLDDKILKWDCDQSTSRTTPEEASVLIGYVIEVQQLEGILRSFNFINEEDMQSDLLNRAQSILQTGTTKLVDEFNALLSQYSYELSQLLTQHEQSREPDHMNFQSPAEENIDDFSCSSFGEEPADSGSHNLDNREHYDNVFGLISPTVLSNLKSIVDVLFQCNYGEECCQAYICARKVALDDFLSTLGMESFGIEDVLKMDWPELNRKINIWKHTMKVFISVYLASDKRLCNLIFGDLPRSVRESCFTDTSKSSVFQLLTFGLAVAISAPKPEKLFQIINIYEVFDGLLSEIENFFPEYDELSILNECHHLSLKLCDSVKATMDEFVRQIRANISTTAFARAGVHHLTKYVMNYIRALAAYGEIIIFILNNKPDEDQYSAPENPKENASDLLGSPFSQYVKSVTLVLESNLDAKSRLYNDDAKSNIFMMNNIHYMVQKVKNSDLRHFVADEWIRAHNAKFQNHAREYLRASWNSVINFLSEDNIRSSGTPSKRVLKQKFEGFNHAFEEVYKTQIGWVVPDGQLRDDLRIWISTVLHKYRVFYGKHADSLEGEKHRERYIKYSADDVENSLLRLFEGSDRTLHYPQRK